MFSAKHTRKEDETMTTRKDRIAEVLGGVCLPWETDPDTDGLVAEVAERADLDAYRTALGDAGYEVSTSSGNVGEPDEGKLYLWVL